MSDRAVHAQWLSPHAHDTYTTVSRRADEALVDYSHQSIPPMTEKKVFRVLIGEQQTFYADTEANSADEAMEKIRTRLQDPHDDMQPIEDNSGYEGYKVEDAVEIPREKADLER